MKRIIALLLSALLFLSPALCAADEALPGGLLCLEEGSGYTVTVDPEDDSWEITDPDGNVFTGEIQPIEELGMTEAFFRTILPSMVGTSSDGLTYGDSVKEVDEFAYITMDYYGIIKGFTAVGCDAILFIYIMGEEDISAYEGLLGALCAAGGEKAEAPAPAETYSASGIEDVAGFYDIEMTGVRNTNNTLILTPGGHGRLSSSTSSVIFNYEVRDGQILPDTDDAVFSLGDDGSVTIRIDDISLRYVKRSPVAGSPRMTGKWKASKMITNGMNIDSAMLGILGLSIDFTAYDDGTIDWYAVSDTEGWTAQGWGIDEDGLYLYNGSRNSCTLEDGVLCFIQNNGSIFFTYEGPVE